MGNLVLSRKHGQAIVIGEGANKVVICVASIQGDKVRIAIDAPKEVPIYREEIWEEIYGEKD